MALLKTIAQRRHSRHFVASCAIFLLFPPAEHAHAEGTEELCRQYAQEAVRLVEESIKKGCGFLSVGRWSPNYDDHYSWCFHRKGWMFDGTGNENRARSEEIAKECHPSRSSNTPAPVTPIQPVQPEAPKVADFPTDQKPGPDCGKWACQAVLWAKKNVWKECGDNWPWTSDYKAHFEQCAQAAAITNKTPEQILTSLDQYLARETARCDSEYRKRRDPYNEQTRRDEWKSAAFDRIVGGKMATMRYGNWVGPGWWGGSERDDRVGVLPPIDDLDATGQKHDFGYEIAEELERKSPGLAGFYKLVADLIAIRDALALDRDPTNWKHPPKVPALASTYVNRLVIAFEDYQTQQNREESLEFVKNFDNKSLILYLLASKRLSKNDRLDIERLTAKLDGLPNFAEFEKMQMERVEAWNKKLAAYQARKGQVTPPQASSACGE